jgi:hypothetical protein
VDSEATARSTSRSRSHCLRPLAESGESDESDEKIEERLRAEIAGIDAPSIENENWLWSAIADEFGTGM